MNGLQYFEAFLDVTESARHWGRLLETLELTLAPTYIPTPCTCGGAMINRMHEPAKSVSPTALPDSRGFDASNH